MAMTDDSPKITRPVLRGVVGGKPDQDARLHAAASYGLPISMRIQPTVIGPDGNHTPLVGIRWLVDFPSVESAQEFYMDLDQWVRSWVQARS